MTAPLRAARNAPATPLQQRAEFLWSGAQALASNSPPIATELGVHLRQLCELNGVEPPREALQKSCERCESPLQPGVTCSVRVDRAKQIRRSNDRQSSAAEKVKKFTNRVAYKCHICGHSNLKEGTPGGHVKTKVAQEQARLAMETISNRTPKAPAAVTPSSAKTGVPLPPGISPATGQLQPGQLTPSSEADVFSTPTAFGSPVSTGLPSPADLSILACGPIECITPGGTSSVAAKVANDRPSGSDTVPLCNPLPVLLSVDGAAAHTGHHGTQLLGRETSSDMPTGGGAAGSQPGVMPLEPSTVASAHHTDEGLDRKEERKPSVATEQMKSDGLGGMGEEKEHGKTANHGPSKEKAHSADAFGSPCESGAEVAVTQGSGPEMAKAPLNPAPEPLQGAAEASTVSRAVPYEPALPSLRWLMGVMDKKEGQTPASHLDSAAHSEASATGLTSQSNGSSGKAQTAPFGAASPRKPPLSPPAQRGLPEPLLQHEGAATGSNPRAQKPSQASVRPLAQAKASKLAMALGPAARSPFSGVKKVAADTSSGVGKVSPQDGDRVFHAKAAVDAGAAESGPVKKSSRKTLTTLVREERGAEEGIHLQHQVEGTAKGPSDPTRSEGDADAAVRATGTEETAEGLSEELKGGDVVATPGAEGTSFKKIRDLGLGSAELQAVLQIEKEIKGAVLEVLAVGEGLRGQVGPVEREGATQASTQLQTPGSSAKSVGEEKLAYGMAGLVAEQGPEVPGQVAVVERVQIPDHAGLPAGIAEGEVQAEVHLGGKEGVPTRPTEARTTFSQEGALVGKEELDKRGAGEEGKVAEEEAGEEGTDDLPTTPGKRAPETPSRVGATPGGKTPSRRAGVLTRAQEAKLLKELGKPGGTLDDDDLQILEERPPGFATPGKSARKSTRGKLNGKAAGRSALRGIKEKTPEREGVQESSQRGGGVQSEEMKSWTLPREEVKEEVVHVVAGTQEKGRGSGEGGADTEGQKEREPEVKRGEMEGKDETGAETMQVDGEGGQSDPVKGSAKGEERKRGSDGGVKREPGVEEAGKAVVGSEPPNPPVAETGGLAGSQVAAKEWPPQAALGAAAVGSDSSCPEDPPMPMAEDVPAVQNGVEQGNFGEGGEGPTEEQAGVAADQSGPQRTGGGRALDESPPGAPAIGGKGGRGSQAVMVEDGSSAEGGGAAAAAAGEEGGPRDTPAGTNASATVALPRGTEAQPDPASDGRESPPGPAHEGTEVVDGKAASAEATAGATPGRDEPMPAGRELVGHREEEAAEGAGEGGPMGERREVAAGDEATRDNTGAAAEAAEGREGSNEAHTDGALGPNQEVPSGREELAAGEEAAGEGPPEEAGALADVPAGAEEEESTGTEILGARGKKGAEPQPREAERSGKRAAESQRLSEAAGGVSSVVGRVSELPEVGADGAESLVGVERELLGPMGESSVRTGGSSGEALVAEMLREVLERAERKTNERIGQLEGKMRGMAKEIEKLESKVEELTRAKEAAEAALGRERDLEGKGTRALMGGSHLGGENGEEGERKEGKGGEEEAGTEGQRSGGESKEIGEDRTKEEEHTEKERGVEEATAVAKAEKVGKKEAKASGEDEKGKEEEAEAEETRKKRKAGEVAKKRQDRMGEAEEEAAAAKKRKAAEGSRGVQKQSPQQTQGEGTLDAEAQREAKAQSGKTEGEAIEAAAGKRKAEGKLAEVGTPVGGTAGVVGEWKGRGDARGRQGGGGRSEATAPGQWILAAHPPAMEGHPGGGSKEMGKGGGAWLKQGKGKRVREDEAAEPREDGYYRSLSRPLGGRLSWIKYGRRWRSVQHVQR